ncbi:MAG: lecithin retinol acyltransferase family protein [Cellulosilyticaceae bacterium]
MRFLKFREYQNTPQPGDIVGVNRLRFNMKYEHYGLYVGNNKIVHYCRFNKSDESSITETDFEFFLKDSNLYFIFDCKTAYKKIRSLHPRNLIIRNEFRGKNKLYLYSPTETIERAYSRIGETKYNLALNNCEHFAIWCKTGLSKSYQVQRFISFGLSGKTKFIDV